MGFRRNSVNKKAGARKFRKQVEKVKGANIARPQRGGYRL